jgi:hypothetical protein
MMSKMYTTNSIKRRKTDHEVGTCLADLPIGILEHASSFLAAPSRAFFAVALKNTHPPDENPSSIEQQTTSSVGGRAVNHRYVPCSTPYVAGSDWETLNFGDIEKELAAKLSDDDLSDVLQHVDAVNNVKRLKLANCTNITGVGLIPLQFSTVIEQIDLSLTAVGEDPRMDPEPPISCDLVLPILDSIIS